MEGGEEKERDKKPRDTDRHTDIETERQRENGVEEGEEGMLWDCEAHEKYHSLWFSLGLERESLMSFWSHYRSTTVDLLYWRFEQSDSFIAVHSLWERERERERVCVCVCRVREKIAAAAVAPHPQPAALALLAAGCGDGALSFFYNNRIRTETCWRR
jgi:hypothetical protein